MVEPYDPVLIKSDEGGLSGSGPARYFYSAQQGLRFKIQPHFFRIHSELEVTCVSHVGSRRSGSEVLEGRAKWTVRQATSSRQRTTSAGSSIVVDKWPDQNGRRATKRKKKKGNHTAHGSGTDEEKEKKAKQQQQQEEDDERNEEGDDDDDDDDIQVGRRDEENDRNATLHHSGLDYDDDDDDNDGTAQSISDSESPSRRTQPVVGSYPGNAFIIICSLPFQSPVCVCVSMSMRIFLGVGLESKRRRRIRRRWSKPRFSRLSIHSHPIWLLAGLRHHYVFEDVIKRRRRRGWRKEKKG